MGGILLDAEIELDQLVFLIYELLHLKIVIAFDHLPELVKPVIPGIKARYALEQEISDNGEIRPALLVSLGIDDGFDFPADLL